MLLVGACGQEPAASPPVKGAPTTPPARVIVIGPSSADTLAWLGVGQAVVGVSDYCTEPSFDTLPRVGGQLDPNLERIAALDPDCVIVQGAHPRVEAWCAQEGVRFQSWKTQSVDAWYEEVATYEAWFQVDPDDSPLPAWRAAFDQVSLPVDDPSQAARVLLVASRDPDRIARLMVAGRGSFLGELLEHIGMRSVFSDHERDYFDLAEESLLELDPDLICELGGTQSDRERLELWSAAFPGLRAVQERRVVSLQEEFIFRPGPRMLDTVRLMRARLLFHE